MKKTKFPSHKQFLRGLLFHRNVKRTRADQRMLHFFLFFFCIFFVETNDNNPNVTTATNLFSSVYVVGMTCFDECFLFYVITKRQYFLKSLSLLGGFFQPACCCVLWKKCFERGLHFTLSPQLQYNASKIKFVLAKIGKI